MTRYEEQKITGLWFEHGRKYADSKTQDTADDGAAGEKGAGGSGISADGLYCGEFTAAGQGENPGDPGAWPDVGIVYQRAG